VEWKSRNFDWTKRKQIRRCLKGPLCTTRITFKGFELDRSSSLVMGLMATQDAEMFFFFSPVHTLTGSLTQLDRSFVVSGAHRASGPFTD
jgi:hypothetical protein